MINVQYRIELGNLTFVWNFMTIFLESSKTLCVGNLDPSPP